MVDNKFIARNARQILRMALEKLHTSGYPDKEYEANVFRAMSLAYDCGYATTLRASARNDGGAAVFAVIELPTGRVAFELYAVPGMPSLPSVSAQAQYAFEFCRMVEDGHDTPADPYNGHCRDCYAFKGQWGGECVLPECTCHVKQGD